MAFSANIEPQSLSTCSRKFCVLMIACAEYSFISHVACAGMSCSTNMRSEWHINVNLCDLGKH